MTGTEGNSGRYSGDTLRGRTVASRGEVTFYYVSNQQQYWKLAHQEMCQARWLWVDTRFNPQRNEHRFYFYTENLKLSAVHIISRQHGNSYFRVIGVSRKTVQDRLSSVRFGVRVYLAGFTPVVGEHWRIPRNMNSLDVAREVIRISQEIKEYTSDEREGAGIRRKEKEQEYAWGEAIKEIIAFQDDYERQNTAPQVFRYSNFEPVREQRIVGVAYKFLIAERNTPLDEALINQELIISSSAALEPGGERIKGAVTQCDPQVRSIVLGFQSTVDFGKFPPQGYLLNTMFNVTYKIQAKAVDSLVQGKSVNKALLDILLRDKFEKIEIPADEYVKIPWISGSRPEKPPQELAVNMALNVKDLMLVQGPPGTGKTSIIVEMVRQFIKRGQRVLISSKNNLAVDNVLEKCIHENISCVRLGREERVNIEKVKTRLLDRAAVELQKDIINNCSSEERQIMEQLDQQERLLPVFHENKEEIISYIQAGREIERYQKNMDKRLRTIKLMSIPFYLGAHFLRLLNLLLLQKERAQAAWERYQEQLAARVASDPKYRELNAAYTERTSQQKIIATALDEKFKQAGAAETFSYRELTEEDLEKEIKQREELAAKYRNKQSIVKEWIRSLEQRQQSLYPLLLNSVMVVGATCIGINTNSVFKDVDFDVAIIDEAGQITIFDILVPMSRAKKVILIGDHMQLPPVCEDGLLEEIRAQQGDPMNDWDDEEEGPAFDYEQVLKISLFENLFHSCPAENKIMLDRQFRMHPLIADFISQEFYGGNYKSGLKAENRDPSLLGIDSFRTPLYFIDTLGMGELRYQLVEDQGDKKEYYNPTEAEVVSELLLTILEETGKPESIGVITPYNRQKVEITEIITETLQDHYRSEFKVQNTLEKLEIGSVDSFQGRDKEVIIFSFTRSNPEKGIGFLRELRRMNVTMTRAKYLLFMVGDSSTLTQARDRESRRFFRSLLSYVKKIGGYAEWRDLQEKISMVK